MPAITTIKMRRGTAASWASTNPVLAAGEPGLETDTEVLKFGDGTTAWASLAPALSGTYVRYVLPPTGVAAVDTARITAAAVAANAAGGGEVRLRECRTSGSLVPYALNASLPVYPGVVYIGIQPIIKQVLNASGVYLADGEWAYQGGTVLQGDGTFPCWAANTVDLGSVGANLGLTEIPGAGFINIGLDNFTVGLDVGAQHTMGLVWGKIDRLYAKNCSVWGVRLINFAHMDIGTITTCLCQNGQYYATKLDASVFQPCNSDFLDLYNIIPRDGRDNRLCRGIVFEAMSPSGTTASLGQIDIRRLQVNGFNKALLSVSATFTSASANITVPDGTKFLPRVLVTFATTANGVTAGRAYVVKTVVGNTITIGSSYTGAAIVASGSGAVTLTTYGFPNIELASTGSSTSMVQAMHIGTVDSEGDVSAAIYMENVNNIVIDNFGGIPSTALVDIVGRKVTVSKITCCFPATTDFDSLSSSSQYDGARYTNFGYPLRGLVQDSAAGVACLNITTGTLAGVGGDIQARTGNFLYPAAGMGEHIFVLNSTSAIGPQSTGDCIFAGSSPATWTLPTVLTDATPGSSNLGVYFDCINVGTATLTVVTDGTQTFNDVVGLTSLAVLPGHGVKVIAIKTASGLFRWSARHYTLAAVESPALVVPPASMFLDAAAATWFVANYPLAHRFTLNQPRVFRYVDVRIGVASGNVQGGVIKLSGANMLTWTRVMDSGVIACPTAGNARLDCGATLLTEGEYAVFFWTDNTTIQLHHTNGTLGVGASRASIDMGTRSGGIPANGTNPGWTNRTLVGLALEGDS